MKAVSTDRHLGHDPRRFVLRGRFVRGEERPERATLLKAGLARGGHPIIEAERHPRARVLAVHSADYLAFLETASTEWATLAGASDEVIGNVHPVRRGGTYPSSITGRAGWHMQDMACGIGPNTFEAAMAGADIALTAADLILTGEPAAYALCRPPGHHAYRDMAGGHCFLNNSAIVAAHLKTRHERVAILDVDVHHGNGTQEVFYRDPHVLTVSLHADPARFYPFYWGYAHERGEGPGEGANLNCPYPVGADDATVLGCLATGIAAVHVFSPAVLVVALGLDAAADDPFGGARMTSDGFRAMGQAIAALRLPTLFVQEGGYVAPSLSDNLFAVLAGFEEAA